jgi:hypothetical protein
MKKIGTITEKTTLKMNSTTLKLKIYIIKNVS